MIVSPVAQMPSNIRTIGVDNTRNVRRFFLLIAREASHMTLALG